MGPHTLPYDYSILDNLEKEPNILTTPSISPHITQYLQEDWERWGKYHSHKHIAEWDSNKIEAIKAEIDWIINKRRRWNKADQKQRMRSELHALWKIFKNETHSPDVHNLGLIEFKKAFKRAWLENDFWSTSQQDNPDGILEPIHTAKTPETRNIADVIAVTQARVRNILW